MQLSDVALPGTAAVGAALEVATRYCSPALLHHSIRSWAWARGFSEVLGIPVVDPEALAVAALLHDVGLVDVFDAARVPFETAGGHVGWVLTAGAGWAVARRERVVEIIERHMQPEVDPRQDPDGHLLEIATGLDISGRRADVLPPDLVAAVLRAHPRGSLGSDFGACLQDQAVRKPGSQAARLVSNGLLERLATNPLER